MKLLQDKVVIITGAGRPRGMGQATALKFAEHGAKVVITDLVREGFEQEDGDALQKVLAGVKQHGGGEGLAVAVDVTNRDQVKNCVDQVISEFGTIDVLVNNAGTDIGAGPFLEQTDSMWDISYAVNLKGINIFCQEVIPIMQKNGGGSIVNNSSMLGIAAQPFSAAYTATKFGVVGLTKVIASEFGKDKIRCNTVCPGSIKTMMQDEGIAKYAKWSGISLEDAWKEVDGNALGRSAEPEEVADAILYLASPIASFVSGVALPVTGAAFPGL